ncbi:hypothetical protein [Burkholderia sp. JKS000303]|uniref:hypothetical protein n=1 Tax=Burkholderia sp. JKS000303 TaxID=1938747 RepID=UPI000C014D94|nr:hypothetical protein [Burkholderia sp. JKS000303]PFH12859.1 hypothetical protein BX604_7279 [Burkholderia sp. JKS000303]
MLPYPDQLNANSPAQGKMAASTVPAPASEIDAMMSRLLTLVGVLDAQQQEIEARLRVVLAPPCPLTSVPAAAGPEAASAHGVALSELGSHIAAVIDRNCELLNRMQL